MSGAREKQQKGTHDFVPIIACDAITQFILQIYAYDLHITFI